MDALRKQKALLQQRLGIVVVFSLLLLAGAAYLSRGARERTTSDDA